jgi:PAS domain S-box-containing protein
MEFKQEDTTKTMKATSKPPGRLAAALTEIKAVERPAYDVGWMVARVVVIYVITGALWILLSDRLLNALVHDQELVMKLSMVKGWAYVVVTAVLLFVLLRRETRHWVAERAAREAAELVTRESEQRFRQLFDLAPLPVGFYKLDGVAVDFNRRFKEELGYTVEELPTVSHWQKLAHPDELERKEAVAKWETAIAYALKNKTNIAPDEYRIRCKNGETRTYLISGSIFGDGVLVALVDITERKRAEDALRESEARYRLLASHTADVIWVIDVSKNRYAYVSPSVERLRGYTPEEVLNQSIEAAMTPASYAMVQRELPERLAAFKAGDPEAVTRIRQIEQTRKDGSTVWTEVSTTLVKTPSGAIELLGVSRDITARRQTEEALREGEERFRQMAESIDEIFWMLSVPEHKLLYVNPAYERIWARSCESLYANPGSWSEAIHPEDRERVLASSKKRQVGEGYTENYRIVRPDGHMRWILVRTFPVRDSSGKVFRMVGVATDITEQRKLEEQFRHAQKMEALGTLAGGIAHDFNNIIGAITGYAELAKMDSTLPAVQSCHEEILSACGRAGDLVRQILAFSRQREQQRTPLQLWQTVTEATRLLRAVLPATVEFKIELDRDAPPVLADPTQIHQVVMNLCTNALHAMAGKVGQLGVSIKTFHADEPFARAHAGARLGRYACLVVSDTGHGMEQLVLDRIFEPFFTTKAPGEGTGLGLSVVHGIVQAHDGIITVESVLNAGTTFNLYFPEYEGDAVETSIKDGSAAAGQGQRIMVIDDEESLARVIAKSLEKLGYVAETMSEPVEALAAFRAAPENYELIITDLTMPKMTGLELGAVVHNEKPQMPIILMTGFSESLTDEQLKLSGIKEVLLKPMTLHGLGRAVQRMVKK